MAKAVEEKSAAEINAARLKALEATIDKIEKDYGKGTIMKLGDQPEWDASQVIPSGSIALDHALANYVLVKVETKENLENQILPVEIIETKNLETIGKI